MPKSRIAGLAVVMSAALSLAAPAIAQQRGVDLRDDPSRMPESGPGIVGGTGATAGPNSKNQAIMPMPRSEQELSERQPDSPLPREVRPMPGGAKPLPQR
ncbi:MAG: hypothetical protein AB7F22_09740 [Reyranella sp.]|uniref:hypothetical protein n=1 Tax=Reyranella sp. TaxID=1929291 RepID=UPI003D106C20